MDKKLHNNVEIWLVYKLLDIFVTSLGFLSVISIPTVFKIDKKGLFVLILFTNSFLNSVHLHTPEKLNFLFNFFVFKKGIGT